MKEMRGKSFKIPYNILNLLEEDRRYFDEWEENLLNSILYYYGKRDIKKDEKYINYENLINKYKDYNNGKLFIKLNKSNNKNRVNKENLEAYLFNSKYEIKDLKKYVLELMHIYYSNIRCEREKIIFEEEYNILKYKIEDKQFVNIRLKESDKCIDIMPYAFKISKEMDKNYLIYTLCNEKKLQIISLSSIKVVNKKTLTSDKNEKIVKEVENILKEKINMDFNPFNIGFDNDKIVAKLTEKGIEILKYSIANRPSYEVKDNTYIFNCSENLALEYFAKFYEEIEIISPKNIRDKLRDKFRITYEAYLEEHDI
ncbi:hypothetical protein [Oceanivirga salmonicida]|uniref:hypothetical protein n=1 Tax=Oceanivirga salmonicida TaxID=1769291 RepID=UPI0012E2FCA6|nr:hypothetical protein [Oceanivirga salmonicida]